MIRKNKINAVVLFVLFGVLSFYPSSLVFATNSDVPQDVSFWEKVSQRFNFKIGHWKTKTTSIEQSASVVFSTDYTPRVAFWWGKVNQHIDSRTGLWATDPNGLESYAGASVSYLLYCKMFYPSTTSVEPYRIETISGWRNRGNVGGPYTGTVQTYRCVSTATPSVTVLSPNGGETYQVGQRINIYLAGGLSMTKVGLVYDDFDPNEQNSDGNEVHWLSVSSDAGQSFVWDGVSFMDENGNKNYFTAGTGSYKIVAIKDVNDNKCYKNKISDCVFDISDGVFTITSPVSSTHSVRVLSPNNGEVYSPGQQVVVRWETNNIERNPNTLVAVMDDRISGWQTLSLFGSVPALNYANLVSSNGSKNVYQYIFTLPSTFNGSLPPQYKNIYGGKHYKILVNVNPNTGSSTFIEDLSDASFSINTSSEKKPLLKIISPNGGEVYDFVPTGDYNVGDGAIIPIKWDSSGFGDTTIYASLTTSTSPTPSTTFPIGQLRDDLHNGYRSIVLPSNFSPGVYYLHLSVAANGKIFDFSDAPFTLRVNTTPTDTSPLIKLLSPNGGEIYSGGNKMKIKWETTGIPLNNNISLCLTNIDGTPIYLTNDRSSFCLFTKNDGVEKITIPKAIYRGIEESKYNLRISASSSNSSVDDGSGQYVFDNSDNSFTIRGISTPYSPITVTSPNGGEVYAPGQSIDITWKDLNRFTGSLLSVNIISVGDTYGGAILEKEVLNNGVFRITLPDESYYDGKNHSAYGKNFKIEIIKDNFTKDRSFNFFTISK